MAAACGGSAGSGDLIFTQDTSGAWSWTSTFAGSVLLELTGPGGQGGLGQFDPKGGGSQVGYGAGGGGKTKKSISVTNGQTLSGSVGAGGSGAATTCASPAMSAAAGGAGVGVTSAGAGGAASGGDTNLSGRNGGLTNYWDGGGAAEGGGDQTISDADGTTPGGGGAGYLFGTGNGANGRVTITRTS
jgi:hypothetical protein